MKRCYAKLISTNAVIFGGLALVNAANAATTTIDYNVTTSSAGSALINGGYFFPRNTDMGGGPAVAGSGQYTDFLAVQGGGSTGTEYGFNNPYINNGTKLLDTTQGVALNNAALRGPSTLSTAAGAQNYWVFGLDLNEAATSTKGFIALDDLKIFASDNATILSPNNSVLTLAALQTTMGNPVYDIDDGTWSGGIQTKTVDRTVLMDYNNIGGGSGNDDFIFLVPKSLIPSTSQTIVLYTGFGTVFSSTTLGPNYLGKDWSADTGGEQWRVVSDLELNYFPTPVPEAGTAGAAGLTAVAAVSFICLRRRRNGV